MFETTNHFIISWPLKTSHHRRLAAVDLLLLSCPEVNCIFQLLAVFRSAQNIKATCIISQLLGLGSKTSLKPLNSIGQICGHPNLGTKIIPQKHAKCVGQGEIIWIIRIWAPSYSMLITSPRRNRPPVWAPRSCSPTWGLGDHRVELVYHPVNIASQWKTIHHL